MPLAQVFAVRTPTRTEADIQQNIGSFLTLAKLGLAESQVAKVEVPTGDGKRIDIAYGRLVIEVKKDIRPPKAATKAEEQLEGYLRSQRERTDDEYAGIITDGLIWRLYTLVGDDISRVQELVLAGPESADRLQSWLDAILLTGPKLKPIPARIEDRLGASSPRYKLDRARLAALYDANANSPEVALKRQLWARLLRTALGTSFDDDRDLFLDHTLLVIEAEVIAHLTVGVDIDALPAEQVLAGNEFHKAGIINVVEPDFFDWPATVDGGAAIVRDIVRELSQFDWTAVKHDVLKHLYEAIITPEVRKGLGEYYTPDWLAQLVVDETVSSPLEQRAMDPACGSGTFVFHLVRKYLAAADEAGIPNRDALAGLTSRVMGMDIHPVSVVLARVTYLLAIGPERLQDRGQLTIPVYLGDSIQWGRSSAQMMKTVDVEVEVQAADLAESSADDAALSLGETLVFPLEEDTDPLALDALIAQMAELVASGVAAGKPRPPIDGAIAKAGYTSDRARKVLRETFADMYRLAQEGRDHIWGYFVRNQIRPIWLSQNPVDVLVGNPPWVAYRYMTAAMQKVFKTMSTQRGLWAGGKVSTNQDLVALFIARSSELYLRDGGKFAYVTPYAVLSRMQYEGFRGGHWHSQDLNPTAAMFGIPWDISDVRPTPFPVPAAVVFGTRGTKASAMGSTVWVATGRVKDLKWSEGTVVQLSAEDTGGSPYASRPVQGATIVPRMLHFVEEVPAGALGFVSGTTAVTSARSTLEKSPWKSLPSVSGVIESKFVFSVLLGESIVPYRVSWPKKAVLPVTNGKLLNESEIARYPRLAQRWGEATGLWSANASKSNKLTLRQRLDFQGGVRRQLDPTPQRVVYAASGNRIAAAVVGPDAIIEHSLYWLRVGSMDEANYLTAILNSEYLGDQIAALQSKGLFGARHIDMLPWRLPIPYYDGADPAHSSLAVLGQEAADFVAAVNLADVAKFTQGRRVVREALAAEGLAARIEAAVATVMLNRFDRSTGEVAPESTPQ